MNRIRLNQLRIVCADSDRAGLHVKSTLDTTFKLDGKTDESISWPDNDLIVIQNKLLRSVEITLEAIKLPDGRHALVSPSRQSAFRLWDKDESHVHCARKISLRDGESMTIRSSEWSPQGGGGAVFPV